jgi:hypothetical protein
LNAYVRKKTQGFLTASLADGKKIAVYSEGHKTQIYIVCENNAEFFNVKTAVHIL